MAFLALAWGFLPRPAEAEVVRHSNVYIDHQHFNYVYQWSDPEVKPRAAAVIIHGLGMHGLVYDAFARHLAEAGVIVYAPDLRGYGRWYKEEVIDYNKSRADLLDLVTALKNEHPNLPLYCMGESLGAGFAMYVAAERPDLVKGLILASPAIKRRLHVFPRLLVDIGKGFALPNKQLDLVPYIRYFASEDNRIIDEKLSDPLVRTHISLIDIYKTLQAMRPTLKYAQRIKATTPVLIIQGEDDRILRADAVMQLMSHLGSSDDTVKWFKNKGHLILETAYLQTDALNTIDTWLERVENSTRQVLPLSVSYEIHHLLPENTAIASD